MTDDVVRDRTAAILGDDARTLVDDYRSRRPGAPPRELWLDIATDRVFRMPAIALLEAQGPHAPTWMYLFTYETPVFGGILRSTHALEIPVRVRHRRERRDLHGRRTPPRGHRGCHAPCLDRIRAHR